eukprot:scaffold415_cov124-Isochrysis_galbana.AAC.11
MGIFAGADGRAPPPQPRAGRSMRTGRLRAQKPEQERRQQTRLRVHMMAHADSRRVESRAAEA